LVKFLINIFKASRKQIDEISLKNLSIGKLKVSKSKYRNAMINTIKAEFVNMWK